MNTAAPAHAHPAARALGAATLGLALGALLLQRRAPRPVSDRTAHTLYQASALLAASVLSDSALEHYRGGFARPRGAAAPDAIQHHADGGPPALAREHGGQQAPHVRQLIENSAPAIANSRIRAVQP